MRAARYNDAANHLRWEYDKDPQKFELGRIANMITPCGMISEAIDALQRLDGTVEGLTEAPARQCCERDHNHDGNCDRHPAGSVNEHNFHQDVAAGRVIPGIQP